VSNHCLLVCVWCFTCRTSDIDTKKIAAENAERRTVRCIKSRAGVASSNDFPLLHKIICDEEIEA
jgi:hypothetical protein